jgi:hypothetical protein
VNTSLAQLAQTAAEAAKALARLAALPPDLLAPFAEGSAASLDGSPWQQPKRQERRRGKRRGVAPQPPKGPSQAVLEVRAQEAADFLAGRLFFGR